MNAFQAGDFAGCTIEECIDTQHYLEESISEFKKLRATNDMMWCLSHLSAIRLALVEKGPSHTKKAPK